MNESTLVPREEMNDLDWLARNVHKWPDGKEECLVVLSRNPYPIWSACKSNCGWIVRSEWLARRAELQNKPSWKDAPEWADWLHQDGDGEWAFSEGKPTQYDGLWLGEPYKRSLRAKAGEVLGDWRDTLEKRPEQAEFEPFVSVEDAKITIMQGDGDVKHFGGIIGRSLPLEEDAATAKQPTPKGSGNPILGMVLADLTNRALEGKEKYGEPLLAHNGRNPLWDAYQEALDLAMYLRQAIEEQK